MRDEDDPRLLSQVMEIHGCLQVRSEAFRTHCVTNLMFHSRVQQGSYPTAGRICCQEIYFAPSHPRECNDECDHAR